MFKIYDIRNRSSTHQYLFCAKSGLKSIKHMVTYKKKFLLEEKNIHLTHLSLILSEILKYAYNSCHHVHLNLSFPYCYEM